MEQLINGLYLKTLISTIAASIFAYFIPTLTQKIVDYKESKRPDGFEATYDVYPYTKIMNYVVMIIVFGLLSNLYTGVELGLMILASCIGMLSIRVDQRVRIIPNELVLIILILSFVRAVYSFGLAGLVSSIIAMAAVSMIFYVSSNIASATFGRAGVGAGDVKLTVAMSAMFGTQNVLVFMMSIAIVLLLYIAYGFVFKKFTLKTAFPMALQITYGFLIALIITQMM